MALLEVETGTRCGIAVLVWPRLVALGSTVMKPCPKVTTQARAANNLSNAGVMSNGRSSLGFVVLFSVDTIARAGERAVRRKTARNDSS